MLRRGFVRQWGWHIIIIQGRIIQRAAFQLQGPVVPVGGRQRRREVLWKGRERIVWGGFHRR
jgi:hypothetical protein